MTFEELWQTLPIPFGYEHIDDMDKVRWKPVVEAAFRTGMYDGTYKSGPAQTADSKRIADLRTAVADIQKELEKQKRWQRDQLHQVEQIAALKGELRKIDQALDDPRVDLTITAAEAIGELRSALKVIHTWCALPDSLDLTKTKRICASALGMEQ